VKVFQEAFYTWAENDASSKYMVYSEFLLDKISTEVK